MMIDEGNVKDQKCDASYGEIDFQVEGGVKKEFAPRTSDAVGKCAPAPQNDRENNLYVFDIFDIRRHLTKLEMLIT